MLAISPPTQSRRNYVLFPSNNRHVLVRLNLAYVLVDGVQRHFQQYFKYIVASVLLVEEPEYPEKTTDLSRVKDELYHKHVCYYSVRLDYNRLNRLFKNIYLTDIIYKYLLQFCHNNIYVETFFFLILYNIKSLNIQNFNYFDQVLWTGYRRLEPSSSR
jgi:hypothetical protein